jgi:hypothetical protein
MAALTDVDRQCAVSQGTRLEPQQIWHPLAGSDHNVHHQHLRGGNGEDFGSLHLGAKYQTHGQKHIESC